MAAILVVDDKAANRDFLAGLLRYRGHQVLEANNGAHALALASAHHPSAVITDVLMPVMDGYEFAKRLRAQADLARTVVIFWTAHYRDRNAERLARECGVHFILPKPCEPQLVLETLERALATRPRSAPPPGDFDSEHLRLVTTKLHEVVAALTRAQSMAKLAHIITGPEGEFESWSSTLPELLGGGPADVPPTTRRWLDLVHPEDREAFRATCIEAGAGHERREIVYRLTRADGALAQLRQLMEPLDAQSRGRWFNTVQDVTEQKESEARLGAMARRLTTLQEKERRDIARELHDRVGQNLAALGLNLAQLRYTSAAALPREAQIGECVALVEATGLVIQDVLTELKPPMLANYGVIDALHFHAHDFSRRTGISVTARGPEPPLRLDQESEMALFRIAQAALNNVAQHAQAKSVRIMLERRDGRVRFEIADDGTGFDAQKALAAGRWGLAGMRERAETIGGTLLIDSAPGRGTRIVVDLAA